MYKYIPYHFQFENSTDFLLKYDTSKANLDYLNNSLYRLNIFKGHNFNLKIIDSIKNNSIEINAASKMPPITLTYGVYSSGDKIKLDQFKNYYSLKASILNYNVDLSIPVKSFNIEFYMSDKFYSFKSDGPKFPSKIKSLLKDYDKNIFIVLNNIEVDFLDNNIQPEPFIIHYTYDSS